MSANASNKNKKLISPHHVAEMIRRQFSKFPEGSYRPIVIKNPDDGKIMGFGMLNKFTLDGVVFHTMICFGSEDQRQTQVFVDQNFKTMSIDGKMYRCSDDRLQIKGPVARILSLFM